MAYTEHPDGRTRRPARAPQKQNSRGTRPQAPYDAQTRHDASAPHAPQGKNGRTGDSRGAAPNTPHKKGKGCKKPHTPQPEQIAARRPAAQRPLPEDGHAPLYDQDGGLRLDTLPPEKARRKKARRLTQAEMRRRKLRRRLTTAILVFIVIVAGILLSVLLLFKVSKFEIQNMDGTAPADTGVYTEDQIIAELGIEKGANLFSFRAKEKVAALNAAFPLLENIELRRRLPDTVIVRVQPATESYCIQTDSGWAILSRHLKVISLAGDAPDLPVLTAAVSAAPQQGSALSLDGEGTNDTLTSLLDALEKAGLLDAMTAIDLSDTEEITFVYQGRIRVKLGTLNNLDYKMKWSAYILLNQNGDGCSETDTGVLDVSHLRTDGTIRPTFAQGDPNAAPTPIPAPDAPSDAASDASSAASSTADAPAGDAQPAA
ncbi:MAG: FtsQ-type POTRA domain-containing protein [Faecalibacterium sp.]|jgi:cell division protein FtsQ|nr:FtsQ-type POTRA domain-containing protein [Faecalibacterium sp.]